MDISKLPLSKIPILAKRDLSYIEELPSLRPFYELPPNLNSFEEAIRRKQKENTDRETLVSVLEDQYSSVQTSKATSENIQLLRHPKTFTVVTAHQPSLFTGPLYYVYKILSALKLVEILRDEYPEFQFVPVFITSGEDHDFEEVNHIHLFNKTLRWEFDGQTGPVGMLPVASLKEVMDDLSTILGESEPASKLMEMIRRCHTNKPDYGQAALEFANELFQDFGLVVLNTNNKRLKELFSEDIQEELFHRPSQAIVNQSINQLGALGFSGQATPREINFFYMKKGLRERIVFEGGLFKVLNTTLEFTEKQMLEEIEEHPERFSPNVVMRPIYQERILPNLAYIGGGGELAYWLERKAHFEHFGLCFPILVRRDSVLWIDENSSKRMDKLNVTVEDLWLDQNELVRKFIESQSSNPIDFNDQLDGLKVVFQAVAEKAEEVDGTLVKAVWAEYAKAEKSVEFLAAKFLKAEKVKHDTAIQQLLNLKEKLFPGGGLQERYDNFIPYYLKYGKHFFEVLLENFNPLEKMFLIVRA